MTPVELTERRTAQEYLTRIDHDGRPIRIALALTPENRRQALGLLRERYEWRGYRHSGVLRNGPRRVTLIAQREDTATVGTLTVGMDSPEGLLAEDNYPEEIGTLRSGGRRLFEVNGFAVDGGVRSKRVLAGLFHAATLCALGLYGQTDCVIEVTPAHARFYGHMLGFRQVGESRVCPRVGTVGVLMHLDLDRFGARIWGREDPGGRTTGDRALFSCFFGKSEGKEILERLRQALLPFDPAVKERPSYACPPQPRVSRSFESACPAF